MLVLARSTPGSRELGHRPPDKLCVPVTSLCLLPRRASQDCAPSACQIIMNGLRSWIEWAWTNGTALDNSCDSTSQAPPGQQQPSHQAAFVSHSHHNAHPAAYSTVEAPNDVPETSEVAFDPKKYQRVCDLRKQMLETDPTVKFMLEKLNEVRAFLTSWPRQHAQILLATWPIHCSLAETGSCPGTQFPHGFGYVMIHTCIHSYDLGQCGTELAVSLTACEVYRSVYMPQLVGGLCPAWCEFIRRGKPWSIATTVPLYRLDVTSQRIK